MFSGPTYHPPKPYENHTGIMPALPSFMPQPNTGFIEARVPLGHAMGDDNADPNLVNQVTTGTARLTFNVNKYYGVYGGGSTAGDGVFVYPGQSGPVSGARLEMWRDGSEDLELLAQLSVPDRQRLVYQVVRNIGEWSTDADVLENVRRQAAQLLMEAKSGL